MTIQNLLLHCSSLDYIKNNYTTLNEVAVITKQASDRGNSERLLKGFWQTVSADSVKSFQRVNHT